MKVTFTGITPPEAHPFQPGDSVVIKRRRVENLEPCWKGLYTVILVTPPAVKVNGIPVWIHHNQVKAMGTVPQTDWKI